MTTIRGSLGTTRERPGSLWNTLERVALHSQAFEAKTVEQLELFVAAGAAWWRTAGLEHRQLGECPAVQAALAKHDGEGTPTTDDLLTAIERAIKQVIAQRLHGPYDAAALAYLGFSNEGLPVGKTLREKRAAKELGKTSDRWFRHPKSGPPYYGLSPGAWIIQQIAQGLHDPEAMPTQPERSLSTSEEASEINRKAGAAARRVLHSREEHAAQAIEQLERGPQTLRATWVGPLFLHPQWYFDRRNADTQRPHIDIALLEYLRRIDVRRSHAHRLICRNAARYRAKIDRYVLPPERDRFIADVLSNVDELWGNDGERGPDLCCIDSGFLKVELIFDDSMIVSHRAGPTAPLSGGTIISDPDSILAERVEFDAVFDGSSRGQFRELQELRHFVRTLWLDDSA